jgi:hypothetical protein
MAASTTSPKTLTVGPAFKGSNAASVKSIRITVGATGSNPDVIVDNAATYQILSIPAGVYIQEVAARVITAFTTSVTITLGDTNAAAGYLSSAKIAPQSADAVGIYTASWVGTQDAYAAGRHYLAADQLKAVFGAATTSAGLLEIIVTYTDGTAGTA